MSLNNNTTSLQAILTTVNALPDKVDTSGTATAADIYTGKTATVNDAKITGTNPYNAATVDPAVTSALAAIAEKGVDTTGKGLGDIAGLVAAIEAGGGTSGDCIPLVQDYIYTVESVEGAQYGFSVNAGGYYESQNKSIASSYALCRINLTVNSETDIVFDVINYAENNYDYAIFGNLDTALALSASADTDIKQSYKGMNTSDVQVLTYNAVPVGVHFIDVKFIKDGSDDKFNDSVQFLVHDPPYLIPEEYYSTLQEADGDLKPENILYGKEIFGVIGTVVAASGNNFATGSISPSAETTSLSITHSLGTVPKVFVLTMGGWDTSSGHVMAILYDQANGWMRMTKSTNPAFTSITAAQEQYLIKTFDGNTAAFEVDQSFWGSTVRFIVKPYYWVAIY